MNNKPPSTPQPADYVIRVEKACNQLTTAGKPITADAVAALAGIGRATLYRRPELRALIEEHRPRGPTWQGGAELVPITSVFIFVFRCCVSSRDTILG